MKPMKPRLDSQEFETKNPNLKEVFNDLHRSMGLQVFYNPADSKYYAKGPFGRYEIDCYIKIAEDAQEYEQWLDQYKKTDQI